MKRNHEPYCTGSLSAESRGGEAAGGKAEDHLAPGYTKVLDLRPLPSGIYFVTVQTAKEQWVKRVVKE